VENRVRANLGWMFDGYETFALILVVGVARDLLVRRNSPDPGFAGTVIGSRCWAGASAA
jgi:hypothetical protein